MGKFDMNQDIVLKGVGKTVVRGLTSGRVCVFEKAQTLNITHKTDSEKLYGGDSLSPIFDYPKQSETSVKLTNATFKPSQLGFVMASEVKTDGVKSQDIAHLTLEDKKVSEHTLTNVKALFVVDDLGNNVEIVEKGSEGEDKISVGTNGEVAYGSSMKGKAFDIVYEYDSNGVQTKVLADALPEMVEVFITFRPTNLKSEAKVMNIFIPKARCDGNFTMDSKRDQASTPELTFNAFRKEGVKNVFTVTVADSPAEVH